MYQNAPSSAALHHTNEPTEYKNNATKNIAFFPLIISNGCQALCVGWNGLHVGPGSSRPDCISISILSSVFLQSWSNVNTTTA